MHHGGETLESQGKEIGRRPGRKAGRPRQFGTRPGRLGVAVIVVAVLLGTVVTVLSRSEPGVVLSAFLIAGTFLGALLVQPGSGFLIFPVPPIAYVAAAVVAGLVHDRPAGSSVTSLALNAVQWIGSGFLAMIAATLLAIVIAVARWARGSRPAPPPATSDRAGPAD